MHLVVALVLALLPSRPKALIGRLLYGWEVHPTAKLGHSLILVRKLVMGPGAYIGDLNVIRGLEELRLDEGAGIGVRNWIYAPPLASGRFVHSPNRYPSLTLGKHAGLTVAHQVDCSDRVRIEDFAVVAGSKSTILSHSVNLLRDRQVTGPVTIGEHSAVMAGCILLSGTRIPPRSIVSAGSVVTTRLNQELTFYRGNPAEAVRRLPESLAFFHRKNADADVMD